MPHRHDPYRLPVDAVEEAVRADEELAAGVNRTVIYY